jgi:hypothetical protein
MLMKQLIFCLLATLFMGGCSKEGIDGEATLVVTLHHHSWSVYSSANYRDSVFIKFGAKEMPAEPTHDYDVLFVGDSGEDRVQCEQMKWGSYSVYCAGYDTVMQARVTGGVITKISRSDRKNESGVIVPLAE